MNNFENFLRLHQQDKPFLLGNAWNVQSVKILENLGFEAVATSSAAIAETLGYADGQNIPFEEYLLIIERMAASTRLPFSVDLEAGYGRDCEEIINNIERLHKAGVAGINLEDSIIRNGQRYIGNALDFSKNLDIICTTLAQSGIDIFINIRTDTFILGIPEARKESVRRIRIYEETGIHGIFLPCITRLEDIKAITKATNLPVNVMSVPGLPGVETLREAGVKRISIGNFLNMATYKHLELYGKEILKEGNFNILF